MKMQWTMNEFVAMDEQFVYKFKKPDKAFCTMASLEKSAIEDFQNYMMSYDYRKMRVGYLYGTFCEDDNSVKVECIYEPPQETTDVGFALLGDPMADRVAALADGAGPVLVLPGRSRLTLFEGGEERLAWDPRAVLLQPLHGRPIVLADHPPDDAGAPDAVGRVVAYPEVAAALACESPGGRLKTKLVRPDQPEDGGADVRTTVDPGVLGAFGVTVYVDRERGAAVGDAYLPCVAAALGGAPVPAGPYDRYAL
jgi:hypothetical protein